jgi:IstB-like ATP binding protein
LASGLPSLRYARLLHQASVEDVDYRAARGLDRSLFQALIAGRWIEEAQNLIIEGRPGWAKVGLPVRSLRRRVATTARFLYQRIALMFADLALARGMAAILA